MKHFRFTLASNWYPVGIMTGGLLIITGLLLYQLGTLTGLSPAEYHLWQQTVDGLNLVDILRNSVFLPYQLCLWILQYVPIHTSASLRLVSALWGFIGVVGFFLLLQRWYSRRIAFLGATLFLTSSWFLHIARYASPSAMYLAAPILLALWMTVRSDGHRQIALFLFCVTAMLALYVPGAVWLLVPALVWQRRSFGRAFRHVPLGFAIGTLAASLLLLIPLAISIAWPLEGSWSDALRAFLAIPTHLPAVSQFIGNLVAIPKELFLASNGDPIVNLGHLPLLDAFAIAMSVVGAYVYARDWRLDRAIFVCACLVVGGLLIGAGGLPLLVLLPFVYLLVATGIGYLLQEWLRIFPRNPFARWLGISLVTITVLTAMIYQLTNYFVAWPHAKATRTTFSQKI